MGGPLQLNCRRGIVLIRQPQGLILVQINRLPGEDRTRVIGEEGNIDQGREAGTDRQSTIAEGEMTQDQGAEEENNQLKLTTL